MDGRVSEYVVPVAGTTLSNDAPEGPRAFNVGAEPNLKAVMLKQTTNLEGSAAIPHVMTSTDKEVYVKHEVESIGDDHEIIEAEEVVFETVDTNLPVIVEGAEETAIVDDISQRDVEMEHQEDQLQLKLTSNIIPRKHMEEVGEIEHMPMEGQSEYSRKMVDKNDPRSRVHFVKYLKRDGKTLKIWECGICSKEFRHQYTLMRHLPTHTDERNFKCETCGKAFRQMSTLSQHRAIHSDARPYVCELCKKTFNRVSTLISHRKTHSGHKPHKCQMCGKGFHQKGNLRNHIFTHTNERPYKCELCGKGFNQMSNLMCHKAHSHGDKSRYICNLCHKEFPRRFALRSHEEYKHGIKYRGGERRQELDPEMFREIVSRKQRKKDEKNLRIIHLPNGDRTLADIRELKEGGHLPLTPIQRLRLSKMLSGPGFYQDNVKNATAGVIIDPINTKAMQTAKQAGQTPFALLKPAKGIPVLVKVMAAPNNKQMLVPATAEDLKSAGKITVSPNFNSNNNGNTVKAVQIKVPVVATVIQKVGPDGQLTIQVEPPGPEQESDLSGMQPLEQSESLPAPPAAVKVEDPEPKVQYVREDGSVIPESELQELSPVNLLAAAVNMVHRDGHEEPAVASVEVVDQDTAPGLMELASTGEIQFVRATPDGRNYEVLSREEAEQMMQQPGQTIEIVSDEQTMQEEEEEEEQEQEQQQQQQQPQPTPESEEVNQSSLSAFVDAIRSAGYHVTENQRQIVITEGGEELSPDGTEGEHHIIYGDPEQIMLSEDGGLEMVDEHGSPVQFVIREAGDVSSEEVIMS